jgi:hypothetical protein
MFEIPFILEGKVGLGPGGNSDWQAHLPLRADFRMRLSVAFP